MSFQVGDFTQHARDKDILGLQTAATPAEGDPLAVAAPTRKNRSLKVGLDTLRSSQGLPQLFKRLSKYKFQRRGKQRAGKYASPHHLQNLQGLLEIYQGWYHTLNPRLKFDAMIHNVSASLADPEAKLFLEGVVLGDRERRRNRLERERGINPVEAIAVPQDQQHHEMEDLEENWPEMFGGSTQTQPQVQSQTQLQTQPQAESESRSGLASASASVSASATATAADEFSDDDLYDNTQVRNMASFSTILATSSQMPQSQKLPTGVPGVVAESGFDDFLSDDEAALEEEQKAAAAAEAALLAAQEAEDEANLNFM